MREEIHYHNALKIA